MKAPASLLTLLLAFLWLGLEFAAYENAGAQAAARHNRATVDDSTESRPPPKGLYFQDDGPQTLPENILTLITRKLYPAASGIALVLFFSLLFGTINFYGELSGDQRELRKTWKYLLLWVCTNFIFAMILLLLVLPDGVTLESFTAQLTLYCLAVTALPELSANIRLQLGKSSTRALDLYKYKNKVSALIAEQMHRASMHEKIRDREYLEHYYAEDAVEFRRKLEMLVRQSEISEAEQNALLKAIDENRQATIGQLLNLCASRPPRLAKMLEFFQDEIQQFQGSALSDLMHALQPKLSLPEARQLVGAGITRRWLFVLTTRFPFLRKRLSQKTGIPVDRLQYLHFSTRSFMRKRRWHQAKIAVLGLAVLILIINIINLQVSRTYVSYTQADLEDATEDLAQGAEDQSGAGRQRPAPVTGERKP